MSFAAVSVNIAGAIWEHIDPAYVFLAFIAVAALIGIPLLISVPETKEIKHLHS
jgi:hypothetical protein